MNSGLGANSFFPSFFRSRFLTAFFPLDLFLTSEITISLEPMLKSLGNNILFFVRLTIR